GNRTASKGENRCAASHGLNQGKTEWLWPVDGKQKCSGIAEKNGLRMLIDLAHELHVGSVHERRDLFAKIVFVDFVDLGSDLKRNAAGAGNGDGMVHALFRTDTAEKRQILPARFEVHAVQFSRDPMINRGNVASRRCRLALRVRDRHERHFAKVAIEYLQVGKVLSPMKRGQRPVSDRPEDRKMKLVDMEMKNVELVGPFADFVEHDEIVRDRVSNRRREPKRRTCAGHEFGRGQRVTACKQSDAVTLPDEFLG